MVINYIEPLGFEYLDNAYHHRGLVTFLEMPRHRMQRQSQVSVIAVSNHRWQKWIYVSEENGKNGKSGKYLRH